LGPEFIYQEVNNPLRDQVWVETLRTMISVRGFIYKEVNRYLTLNLYSLHPRADDDREDADAGSVGWVDGLGQ